MANKFLNSAGGNVSPYETSADAATTLSGLLSNATVALDEIIWAKNDSVTAEITGTLYLTAEGATPSHPLRVLCAGDWDDDPSTLSTGSIIGNDGNYNIIIQGYWYFYGVTFSPSHTGSVGSSSAVSIGGSINGHHYIICNNCKFILKSTGSLTLGPGGSSGNDQNVHILNNSTVKFGATSGKIIPGHGVSMLNGFSIDATGSTPTYFFVTQLSICSDIIIFNSDLSNVSIAYLVSWGAGFNGRIVFRNCKLNASTVITYGNLPAPGGEVLIINCDSGDTHTRHARHGYEGTWAVTTSIYATTDPADMSAGTGDTYSILMTASANVSRHLPLYSQWMEVWNDGTAYTPTIEVLVQGDGAAALLSDELWIEVDYNSGTDSPLGTRLTTCPDLLTAGSTVAAGTTAWTGDGYSTERTHKLSTTAITPDKPGFIRMRVALAKSSSAVYVNPPR